MAVTVPVPGKGIPLPSLRERVFDPRSAMEKEFANISRYKIDPSTGQPERDATGALKLNPNFNELTSGMGETELLKHMTDEQRATFAVRKQAFTDKKNAAEQEYTLEALRNNHLGQTVTKLIGSDSRAIAGAINAGGDALAGLGAGINAFAAAKSAGNTVEAQNERARGAMLEQAQSDMRDMNLQNEAEGRAMTGAAVAQGNAFDAGMQGIAMSGIEGSDNMERNLQFGQDRADEQEAMQFNIMNNRADDYERSMANSFSDLSQNKSAAMQQAGGGVMNEYVDKRNAGNLAEDLALQKGATTQDYQGLIAGMDFGDKDETDNGTKPEITGVRERAQPPVAPVPTPNPGPSAPAVTPQTGAVPPSNDDAFEKRIAGWKGFERGSDDYNAAKAAYAQGAGAWSEWGKKYNARRDVTDKVGGYIKGSSL